MIQSIKARLSSELLQEFSKTEKSTRKQLKKNGVPRKLTAVVEGAGPDGLMSALTLYEKGFEVIVVEKRKDKYILNNDSKYALSRSNMLRINDSDARFLQKLGVDEKIPDFMPTATLQKALAQACTDKGINILYSTELEKHTPNEHTTDSKRVKAYLKPVNLKGRILGERVSLYEPDLIVTATGLASRKAFGLNKFGIVEHSNYAIDKEENIYTGLFNIKDIQPDALSGASLWMMQLKRKSEILSHDNNSVQTDNTISKLFKAIKERFKTRLPSVNPNLEDNYSDADQFEEHDDALDYVAKFKMIENFKGKNHELYQFVFAFNGEKKYDKKLEQELILEYVNEVCAINKEYKNIKEVLKDFKVILGSNNKSSIHSVRFDSVNSLISKASAYHNWVASGDFVGVSSPDEAKGIATAIDDSKSLAKVAGELKEKNNIIERKLRGFKALTGKIESREAILAKYSDNVLSHHIAWAASSSDRRMQEIN